MLITFHWYVVVVVVVVVVIIISDILHNCAYPTEAVSVYEPVNVSDMKCTMHGKKHFLDIYLNWGDKFAIGKLESLQHNEPTMQMYESTSETQSIKP